MNKLNGIITEEIKKLPTSIDSFSGPDGRLYTVMHTLVKLCIQRRSRFFKAVKVVLVAKLSELHCGNRISTAVIFHYDIKIAAGLTDCNNTLLCHIINIFFEKTFTALKINIFSLAVICYKVNLDRIITLAHCILAYINIFLRCSPRSYAVIPAELQLACIAAYIIAEFTSQQFIHGNTESFALNVHKSYVDGTDTRENNGSAPLSPECKLE